MANAILFKVEYISREFDLTAPQPAFEFIFQIYNFFSDANEDNKRLSQPDIQLTRAKESVEAKQYPTFSKKRKQAHNEKRSGKKKKSKQNPDTSAQGGQEDSFDNPSVQREVTGAGYTPTQPIPEEFTPLTPVSRNPRCCARYLVSKAIHRSLNPRRAERPHKVMPLLSSR
jgi:hypothetical protein